MKVFEPLMIQSSPSRTAVVFSAARSEPPEGSVIAMAQIFSPARHCGQPALLLLIGAQVDDVGRADIGVDAEARGHGGVELRELLCPCGVEQIVVDAGPAVLLRDAQPEESLLPGLLPHVAGDGLLPDHLLGTRSHGPGDEVADGRTEGLVILCVDVAGHGRVLVVG